MTLSIWSDNMTNNQFEKGEKLSLKIIQLAQNTLLLNLRFMDAAIFRLTPKLAETTLATDGRYIYYGMQYILNRYKVERSQVVRDILHVVLHCVFRHSFVNIYVEIPIWDLASDIAVENIVNSLGIHNVDTKNTLNQKKILDDLQSSIKILSAEHIYQHYKDMSITHEEVNRIRELFLSDDHSIWYNTQERKRLNKMLQESSDKGEQEKPSVSYEESQKFNTVFKKQSSTEHQADSERFALEKEWETVSRQVQMDMETFSKQRGNLPGNLVQQLRELNKERYNYGDFLKKFSVMGEVMKINDEEFDYIFYTYGLKLLRNVPFIEPLEYKEVKLVREFAVAIDTSGSTSGLLVKRFLEKTYSILKNTESFFSRINLHIIQCDADIQEHVKIKNQEEFDTYMQNLTIKGLGGTDFRPVFSLVNYLVDLGEFSRLKGIIYFTDGYGIFPEKKPNYETAFVFIRDEYDSPWVPPWAMKLVLNSKDI